MARHEMKVRLGVFADETEVMSTVRLGWKWFLRINRGDELHIVDECTGEVRRARVTGVYRRDIQNLMKYDLLDNHNPACRTVSGLLEELRACYGEEAVASHNAVSIIHFKLQP